jgi:competence protein ComEC
MRSNGVFLPISLLFFPFVRKVMMIISAFFWAATVFHFLSVPVVFLYRAFANLISLFSLDVLRVVGTIDEWILIVVFLIFILFSSFYYIRILLPVVLLISPLFIYLNPFPQVVFLNAGQGDAILFRSPFARCTVVMDTGPPKEAENLIASLRSKSVDKIDALILTHADADHSGNTQLFLKSFTVKRIIETKQDVNCPQLRLQNLDPVKVFGETNSDSLIYATSLNRNRFLLMADAGVDTEEQLLQRFDLTTDIVKIGHHGSQTATSDAFIGKIRAKLAIISVGKNNFGHPHSSVLARLNAFRLDYLTTRSQGDITFTLLPGFALISDSKHRFRILPTHL